MIVALRATLKQNLTANHFSKSLNLKCTRRNCFTKKIVKDNQMTSEFEAVLRAYQMFNCPHFKSRAARVATSTAMLPMSLLNLHTLYQKSLLLCFFLFYVGAPVYKHTLCKVTSLRVSFLVTYVSKWKKSNIRH